MKVRILSSELVYPLVEIITGEEPLLDSKGKPVTKMEPVMHESGNPMIDLVVVNDVITKRMKMQEVPVMRPVVEVVPDAEQGADGMRFVVNVSDEKNGKPARKVEFVIGRSVFAELPEGERRKHVEEEAIRLFEQTYAAIQADDWTAGLT